MVSANDIRAIDSKTIILPYPYIPVGNQQHIQDDDNAYRTI